MTEATPIQMELPLPEAEPRQEVALVILVRIDRGQPEILVSERENSNQMTLPGGKSRPGELPEECAIRELFEETGLQVTEDYLIEAQPKVFTTSTPDGDFSLDVFFAFWDESTNQTDPELKEAHKHKGWTWMPLSMAISLTFEGKLPRGLFDGWWIEEIYEAMALSHQTRARLQPYIGPIPSYILEDCARLMQ